MMQFDIERHKLALRTALQAFDTTDDDGLRIDPRSEAVADAIENLVLAYLTDAIDSLSDRIEQASGIRP